MSIATQTGGPAKRRPALRLVETKSLACEDWLTVRKSGIGGSDAAAAVGLNPYMSPLELWLEKTGRDANLEKPDPKDTTAPVYWGTLLEPIVAAAYTQQTGNRVRKVNAVLRHPTATATSRQHLRISSLFGRKSRPAKTSSLSSSNAFSKRWVTRHAPSSRPAKCRSSAARTVRPSI